MSEVTSRPTNLTKDLRAERKRLERAIKSAQQEAREYDAEATAANRGASRARAFEADLHEQVAILQRAWDAVGLGWTEEQGA